MNLYNTVTQLDWKYGESVWSIPEDEEEGYVSVIDTNEVLGVIKYNVVTLKPKDVFDNQDNLWIRQNFDSYGHTDEFILINKKNGLLLSGKQGTTSPTTEGQ